MAWRRRAGRAAAALAISGTTLGAAATAPPRAPAAQASDERALAAAERFLDRYVDTEGRVVRHDEGGDTVSEGQAYGMLLALAAGDERRFRLIWVWTAEHLQRDDGLLAWRWAGGAVVDAEPAADADLLAAAALARAAERFDAPDLGADARVVNDAVLEHETMAFGDTEVLLAGPWAGGERIVNPSYWATPAMSELWWTLGERRWSPVADNARAALDELTADPPHLPPDWAIVDPTGRNPRPHASPAGEPPRYGYEAGRVLVQLAVDCRHDGQRIAARAWPFLAGELDGEGLVAAYSLDGDAVDSALHPLALVAAAASAAAAGEHDRSGALLDAATELDERAGSYYGAAWTALAAVWLTTDRLGGCRPGEAIDPER